jgi:hypothetical protein
MNKKNIIFLFYHIILNQSTEVFFKKSIAWSQSSTGKRNGNINCWLLLAQVVKDEFCELFALDTDIDLWAFPFSVALRCAIFYCEIRLSRATPAYFDA